MENLLGFIIFVAIVAISIINKIRTEAKAGQERPDAEDRPISFEDIPEATRRMIYGDGSGDVTVAKPRRPVAEQPETTQRPHPVAARSVEVDYERPQQTQSHRPAPVAQPQPAPRSATQSPPRVQMQQAPRPATPPMRTPMAQTMREKPQQTMAQRPPQPVRQPTRAAAQAARKPAAKPVPKPRMQPAVEAGQGAIGLTSLLASNNDLARGILLREILGPPRAFEDFA